MEKTIVDIENSNDFTCRVDIVTSDEIGNTIQAFNSLIGQVQASFKEALQGTIRVTESVQSLSGIAFQVANGSALQNYEASKMASAMQEMELRIEHVSSNARDALDVSPVR